MAGGRCATAAACVGITVLWIFVAGHGVAADAGGGEGGDRLAKYKQWPLNRLAGDKSARQWSRPRRIGPVDRPQGSRFRVRPIGPQPLPQQGGVAQPPSRSSSSRAQPLADDLLAGLRYWDFSNFPAAPLPITDKFISFEPWNGGFNNIRMSIEFAAALAMATNRTLVLPDKYDMYKLPGINHWEDFFDMDHLARGVPIIHQAEFQKKFGLPDPNGRTSFPKAPVTWNKNVYTQRGWQGIWEKSISYGFGESVGDPHAQMHSYTYCVPTCPKAGQPFHNELQAFNKNPVVIETESWEQSSIVHFSQLGLGQWYTSIFMYPTTESLKLMLRMRNHFHFNERIMEPAEKLLRKIHQETPSFSCMHVRRGDFQFKETWTEVDAIMANTKDLFRPNEHLWVMTEEKDPETFFAPLKTTYQTHFLKDYLSEIPDVDGALVPMIESLVCARARIFSGTFLSSMSGYITRLRGYMPDVIDKTIYFNQMKFPQDYEELNWDSEYPTSKNSKGPKNEKGHHAGVPNWGREFREAWDLEWELTRRGV